MRRVAADLCRGLRAGGRLDRTALHRVAAGAIISGRGDTMNQPPQCVFVANGEFHANQVRAFLEAAGIETVVRGESLRQTHGLTLDGLGAVEILAAGDDIERARSLLDDAEAGRLRLADDADVRDETVPSSHSDQ